MSAFNPLSSTVSSTTWGSTAIRFEKVTLDISTKTSPANYLGAALEGVVTGMSKATGTHEGCYDQGNMAIQSGSQYTITYTFTSMVTIVIPMVVTGINWSTDASSEVAQRVKVTTTSNGGSWTPAIS